MHGIFTVVRIEPGRYEDGGVEMIQSELIPQVKQAPGFVGGVWFGDGAAGHGLIMFESEEFAQAANHFIPTLEFDGVQVVSSEVYAVVGKA